MGARSNMNVKKVRGVDGVDMSVASPDLLRP
jgi:hypothetical protein